MIFDGPFPWTKTAREIDHARTGRDGFSRTGPFSKSMTLSSRYCHHSPSRFKLYWGCHLRDLRYDLNWLAFDICMGLPFWCSYPRQLFDNIYDVMILVIHSIKRWSVVDRYQELALAQLAFPLPAITCLFPMSPIPLPLGFRTIPQPKPMQREPQSTPNLREILFLCYFNLWKFEVLSFKTVFLWVVSQTLTSTKVRF